MNAPVASPLRRTQALTGLALTVLVAAAAGVLAVRGGSSEEAPAGSAAPPVVTATTRTVVYEVAGEGPVEEIAYVVGAGNKLATVEAPKLPWRKEVTLDVGHVGGNALVSAANAGSGKLTCGVLVDGERVYQVTGQSETDVSCSAELAAATAG
jgi:hypothetical protein